MEWFTLLRLGNMETVFSQVELNVCDSENFAFLIKVNLGSIMLEVVLGPVFASALLW